MNEVLRLPKLASSQEASHPRGFQTRTPETSSSLASTAQAENTTSEAKREKKESLKRESELKDTVGKQNR